MRNLFIRQFPPFWPPLRPAFSLVEVMLALAISSLGFVTMLGLVPHGLELARSSADLSAEARIKQKLTGELLTASWSQLNWTGFGPKRFFNDQGIELTEGEVEGGAAGQLVLAYVASVQLPTTGLDLQLPNDGQAVEAQDYLRRVRICIAASSDPKFDFAAASPHRLRTHTAVLADTGS